MKIQRRISAYNNQSRYGSQIEWIVIHYVGGDRDSTAKNNVDYFAGGDRQASAHFFVDEKEIWQSVEIDRAAWHCGGPLQGTGGHSYFGICTNLNSIGIEMCDRKKGGKRIIPNATILNTAWLVQKLMAEYKVPRTHVIRHHDVSGKKCPNAYPEYAPNDWLLSKGWGTFREKITGADKLESGFALQNMAYPSSIVRGTPFTISGKVKSNCNLKRVEIGVVDKVSKKWQTVAHEVYKNCGTVFDVSKADPEIKFARLDVGTYCYRIIVTDSKGTHKRLVNKQFSVVLKAAKKSLAAIAREIYRGECSDKRWSSWGTGTTRRERLKAAGYTAKEIKEIQKLVNAMF